MKTYLAKKHEVTPHWHIVDATDKVLGRMAARIATVLMGKHRPDYTPNIDMGDFVIVLNAGKVKLTGSKVDYREYDWYTRYPGGRKTISQKELLETKPETVISEAVRRMLPKTKLGRTMINKLKVYAGTEHPHQAQRPETLEI